MSKHIILTLFKNILRICLFGFFIFCSTFLYAENQKPADPIKSISPINSINPVKPVNPDENQPIHIQSDSAEFDDKKGSALYRGHVIMTQGTRQLLSETLLIKRDQHGKIDSAIATGKPAHFQAQLSPEQPGQPEKPLAHGQANIVKFFPKENKIYLFENAELTQNENTIKGEAITYSTDSKVLSANPVAGKRTTVILAPRTKDAGTPPLGGTPLGGTSLDRTSLDGTLLTNESSTPNAVVPVPTVKGFIVQSTK